jgi:hypothetical protein
MTQQKEEKTAEEKRAEIIEKIMKVLALSQSPNQNEAAAALARAQRMLYKHNLKMEDIENYNRKEKNKYTYKRLKLGSNRRWRILLASVIARNFLCESVQAGKSQYVDIVGTEENIQVVLQVIPFVERQIDMMSELAFGRQGIGSKTKWKDSFCRGAKDTIETRLKESKESFMLEGETSKALIVQTELEIKEELPRIFGKIFYKTQRRKPVYTSAYEEGKRQGHNVKIFKEIQ